ncbi:uncharacterized protein LOC104443475 isoform X2 [Eucalyptus grandis]|uniref:uncharacterized protein LOC104443475 isoform X2 n=1 Tax=Eucalyptus grandis TaxID=71139 RepID=UPI00192EE1CF|nr:uncharacterized protein LOC104443475 isoform X2 [Eucalyptus grandis]
MFKKMLMGHTDGLSERSTSKDQLLPDPESEIDNDEASYSSEEILFTASFEELAMNHLKYDTIIWLSISLLLVLAWGVGIFMLIYLPYRRHVIRNDIRSRKLYVTPTRIVYKVSRPSFIPFWRPAVIEKNVPLSLVIDIIIEQGWLQSIYGIHTFRVESVARGKAAPVDELQVQGVSNPGLLRKVIITEASKVIQDAGRSWKPSPFVVEGGSTVTSMTDGSTFLKLPSQSWKMTGSPGYPSIEHRGVVPGELLLNKLEEVNKSVKKIESLVEKSQGIPHND